MLDINQFLVDYETLSVLALHKKYPDFQIEMAARPYPYDENCILDFLITQAKKNLCLLIDGLSQPDTDKIRYLVTPGKG